MELYLGTIGEPGFPVISIFFSTTTTKFLLFSSSTSSFLLFFYQTGYFSGSDRPSPGQKAKHRPKRWNTGQKGQTQVKSQTQITCLVENIRNEEEEEKIEMWWKWSKEDNTNVVVVEENIWYWSMWCRSGVDVGSMQGRCVGGKIKIKNKIRGK